ncbi:response regulator [Candidatus Saccharibacteria bacterium]|nr:MAG: response regulator [Candidatus Saccharibacteria bacterium]
MAKLLLVEDDNNLREIYQARLSAEGYDIVAAQNGEEALSIAKQHRPDLIISDVMMPRISGFEMLDILRATPELANTKVIMLTALGQAEDQARAGKLGADKYLVKSQVTLEDIVNCASDLLSGTTIVSPNPDQPADPTASSNPAIVAADQSVAPVANQSTATTPIPTPQQPLPTAVPVPSTATAPVDPATPAPQMPPPDAPLGQPAVPAVVTTVQDPDPLTPPVVPAAAPPAPTPEPVPIVTHKSGLMSSSDITTPDSTQDVTENPGPVTATPPTPPENQPATAPTDPSTPAEQQSLAAEEANIESQIAAFANSQANVPVAPAVPSTDAVDITASNETTLATAVNDLAAAVNEPPVLAVPPSERVVPGEELPVTTNTQAQEPAVVASPEIASTEPTIPDEAVPSNASEGSLQNTSSENTATPAAAVSDESDQVNVAGKKVIAPINDITKGPNLDELLAKEVAKEEAAAGVPSTTVPAPTAPAPAQPDATTPPAGDDPNSIAL